MQTLNACRFANPEHGKYPNTMSDPKNFQIRLSEQELSVLNAKAVSLTNEKKKPYSLQDVVREWIQSGCPITTIKRGKKHVG
jgi:hypothetical protein